MKQISGQINLFDYLKELETISPAQEYFNETGKRTYWQDSQGKPHYWWRQETIHPVEIMGICDDAFCPVCGDGIDEFKWMDCERCPSCGTRISWEPWHRRNDEDNLNLFGENWREKFGKNVKKTKEIADEDNSM